MIRRDSTARWIGAAAVALIFAGRAVAAPDTQPSIDELLNLPSPPETPETPKPPGNSDTNTKGKEKGVALDPEVARRLAGEQAADLFRQALDQMREASDRLGKKLDAGLDTQRVQEEVLAKLDRVVAAVNDQSKSGQKGSPSSGGQQQDRGSEANAEKKQPDDQHGNQSSESASPPVTSDHADAHKPIEETKNEWGNLPPRVRDELRQGRDEPFSPIYKEMTEKYYQGLAEEGK